MDKGCKISKFKFNNFITQFAKAKAFVPDPGKYPLSRSMIIKNKRMHFGKSKRVTMTEGIINNAKKNRVGPGQYKLKFNDKPKCIWKSTLRKSVAFIDDAEFKGMNMPGYYK